MIRPCERSEANQPMLDRICLGAHAPRNDALPPLRHGDHVIGVTDGALQHGILEFIFEAVGWADAALGGKSSAKHRAAVRKLTALKAAPDQFVDRQDRVQRALLVQLALAFDQAYERRIILSQWSMTCSSSQSVDAIGLSHICLETVTE